MIKKIINHIKWLFVFTKDITIPQLYYAYRLPSTIMGGPFAGMKYQRSISGGILLPQLVGSYEDELLFVWEEIRHKPYDLFIDVGAAEGYYAVGIKKFILVNIPAVAFEMTAKGRNNIKHLAAKNGVQVKIEGTATPENLKGFVEGKKAFMIMDVEGAEEFLLDPSKTNFAGTDILVEIHPRSNPQMEQIVVDRFAHTHDVQVINTGAKKLPQGVQYPGWVHEKERFVTDEFRGPQSWVWIKAR